MIGIEAMLNAVLKSIGFNPAEFMSGMQTFLNDVASALRKFDRRIEDIHGKLDGIKDHLEYIKPSGPVATTVDPDLAPPLLENVSLEMEKLN